MKVWTLSGSSANQEGSAPSTNSCHEGQLGPTELAISGLTDAMIELASAGLVVYACARLVGIASLKRVRAYALCNQCQTWDSNDESALARHTSAH